MVIKRSLNVDLGTGNRLGWGLEGVVVSDISRG